LHYYRARFYDGNLGRFISEDPIGFAGGDINLYGYVRNNPAMMRDPSGKIPPVIGVIVVVGILIATSPSYVNAPGPGDKTYSSQSPIMENALFGAVGGYLGGKFLGWTGSKICQRFGGGFGDDIIELGISQGPTKYISNPGEMFGNFGVPKYYTYTSQGQSVFVTPNAMKHLGDLASRRAGNPDYLRLVGQLHQKSLQAAIDDVLSRGPIRYNHMYQSGGTEIMFGAPRVPGELPAVIHFRQL
jgi:hypothetical protein